MAATGEAHDGDRFHHRDRSGGGGPAEPPWLSPRAHVADLRDARESGEAARQLENSEQRGRARHELSAEAMRAHLAERLEAVRALCAALERNELVMHYQPIVDLTDGRVIGAEALVRWDHPTRGLLLPAEFLPLAEDTGLIVPIDNWVLRRACTDLAGWRRRLPEDFTVAVNISARQLGRDLLVASVIEVLADTGLEPAALSIELTEGMLIDANGTTLVELEELRDLGVHLGLDDFGTGYASLTHLQRLPVDFVKVDRSFVAGIGVNSGDAAIVEAVVVLAGAFDLRVIAEGVETDDQQTALRALGCRTGQGWHLGYPQPAAGFNDLLAARRVA